ncbi:tetratricopeptide repeat protein [Portibacter marinus]|uniref:tetratricopeptide repeat protein n=1 Tax=Portibacter marinus TaxID=2898660 RepID=UPI001F44DD29|nr:hypothetical protein [Portibacter marinus]
MDKDYLIDQYVNQKLSEEEKVVFHEILNTDEDFQEEVEMYVDLQKVVREDERQRLQTKVKEWSKIHRRRRRRRSYIYLAILMVASIVSIILVLKLVQPSDIEGMYANYFQVPANDYSPVLRNSREELQTRAFTAYESGEYALAAELFEQSPEIEVNPSLQFFYANSLGATGQFESAVSILEKINQEDFRYREEVYWYLGMFNAKVGKASEAIENFEKYIEFSPDEEKTVQAREIINILER